MDPDELLYRLRSGDYGDASFSELFADLDEWLTSGGFLPSTWANTPPTD